MYGPQKVLTILLLEFGLAGKPAAAPTVSSKSSSSTKSGRTSMKVFFTWLLSHLGSKHISRTNKPRLRCKVHGSPPRPRRELSTTYSRHKQKSTDQLPSPPPLQNYYSSLILLYRGLNNYQYYFGGSFL